MYPIYSQPKQNSPAPVKIIVPLSYIHVPRAASHPASQIVQVNENYKCHSIPRDGKVRESFTRIPVHW